MNLARFFLDYSFVNNYLNRQPTDPNKNPKKDLSVFHFYGSAFVRGQAI